MSELRIEGLRGGIEGREILKGVDLVVRSGEVHALMGRNGSGKSTLAHVITGRPGYHATAGRVLLDGVDLLGLPTWERARAGLFLVPQYPVEVPGVSLEAAFGAAGLSGPGLSGGMREAMEQEAARIGLSTALLDRSMNVDLSGGEKKRNETLQLSLLRPLFSLLDEIDSGLDVDALRAVGRRVSEGVKEWGMGVLAVTHYSRLLTVLVPDQIHVFSDGAIVRSGGPELAEELERSGYAAYSAQP